MRSWLFGKFSHKACKRQIRPATSVRPRLEALEDRLTPSLSYHGGAILASVQTQALYLGAGWSSSTIPSSQFDAFLSKTVSGTASAPAPYLAMLHNGGFTGVTGAGGATTGATDDASLSGTILDSQIQTDLQADIANKLVQAPTANTLYVVFVQPGTVVSFGNGQDSTNTFLAYHSSFSDNGTAIRYAVVPFHGSAGNAQDPWLTSAFDSMTVAASHELAEAVTDPDGTAWFDRSGNEVGDVVNGSTVYLNGYAVQREGSIPASLANFLPMTPSGATAGHTTVFGVSGGQLTVNGGAVPNPSGETGTVSAVSAQGIDDFGQPMVDVAFSDGNAFEYHDFAPNTPTAVANPSFFPWTPLGGHVKQAVAGQAVSYVLLTNGALGEYVDPNYSTFSYGYGVNPGAHKGAIATGVTSITGVGLDQVGVNAVVFTRTVSGRTVFYEWRDVTASASQTSSSSPLAGLHHSEVAPANGVAANSTTQTPVNVLLVYGPPAGAVVVTSPASLPGPSAPAAGLAPVNATTVHLALPDGGGGDGLVRDQSPAPASPIAIGDVPVLGPLFTEAVRALKGVHVSIPAEFWPAIPMENHDAPVPHQPQTPAPRGERGAWTIPLGDLGRYAAPVAAGLCGLGLEREDRRRERLPVKSR
jgi:hypothetical protein